MFGLDKPAGEACPHLAADCRCTIHADRAARGFAGCAAFDCRGAGQLATALFNGLSWRDGDAVRRQMLRVFGLLLEIQRLRLVLRRLGRRDLLGRLGPEDGWTLAALLTTAPAAIRDTQDALRQTVQSRRTESRSTARW